MVANALVNECSGRQSTAADFEGIEAHDVDRTSLYTILAESRSVRAPHEYADLSLFAFSIPINPVSMQPTLKANCKVQFITSPDALLEEIQNHLVTNQLPSISKIFFFCQTADIEGLELYLF